MSFLISCHLHTKDEYFSAWKDSSCLKTPSKYMQLEALANCKLQVFGQQGQRSILIRQ